LTELKINIQSDYEDVVKVNLAVRDFLQKNGIEEHVQNAFDICLTEALNNVIKHAYKEEKNKNIDVLLRKDTETVEVEIIDEGEPRKNLEIPDLNFDPQDINNLPENGMGLFIMKQLMDELNYQRREGKNFFILKKWIY